MTRCRNASRTSRGVSLPELLVVVAILGLGLIVSIPIISHRVFAAELQATAGEFAVSLRAARMVAVTKLITVTVTIEPDGTYSYVDAGGVPRRFPPPPGIVITSTPATIVFMPNGSVQAAALTVFTPMATDAGLGQWQVDTPLSGIPRLERVP